MSIDNTWVGFAKRASFFSASSKHILAEEYKVSKAGAFQADPRRKRRRRRRRRRRRTHAERERERSV